MMKVGLLVSLGAVAASCLASAASNLPRLRAERWVNSPPLSAEALRGKVVLVDFWEYTCVNWIRTAPYVKEWSRAYAPLGLVVIGVHAPEFEFGKVAGNIDRGIRDHGLTYPIAIDNDFAIWRAFGNDAWPAKYLFDDQGRLVQRWIGEGSYDQIEREIRRLLVAANPGSHLPAVCELASTFAKTGQTADCLSRQSRRSSRLTSRNLGEPFNNRPFTPLLGSTSCGNRPVRRAISLRKCRYFLSPSNGLRAMLPFCCPFRAWRRLDGRPRDYGACTS
jgi:thiol-disulfide isomerase/thioredoxin